MSREINKQKINDFINVYGELLGLDKSNDEHHLIFDYLKNTIYRRAKKYEDIKIPVSMDNNENYIIKPTNNEWNIEDLLLNRLFLGLRQINMHSFDAYQTGSIADYTGAYGELYFSFEGCYKVYKDFYNTQEDIVNSIFKTFNHEIGHALKTQYSGGYKFKTYRNDNEKNNLYVELIDRLKTLDNGKYRNEINDRIIDEEIEKEKTGINGLKDGYIFNQEMYAMSFIDEMMNEDEAIELSKKASIQKYTRLFDKEGKNKSGYYLNVPNKASGYCKFYGIGVQLKYLLGKNKCFEIQYGNSDKVLEQFDKHFQDISDEMFGKDKFTPSKVIYYNNITIDKDGRTYEYFLESNLFLAKCYEKRLKDFLSYNNYDEKTLDKILKEIDEMYNYTTHHINKEIDDKLEHLVIYKKLKELILTKKKELELNTMVETKNKNENLDDNKKRQ